MREYETVYLVKPDLPADQLKSLKEKVSNIITKSGGQVLSHADWGKRKLAYDVQKLRYGQYLFLQYAAHGEEIGELERILKYDDLVMKFLTIKLAEKYDENSGEREEPGVPEGWQPEVAASVSKPAPVVQSRKAKEIKAKEMPKPDEAEKNSEADNSDSDFDSIDKEGEKE